jgi:hypothetical protein
VKCPLADISPKNALFGIFQESRIAVKNRGKNGKTAIKVHIPAV